MKNWINKLFFYILIIVFALNVCVSVNRNNAYAKDKGDFYYVKVQNVNNDHEKTIKVFYSDNKVYISGEDVQDISGYTWDKQNVFHYISPSGAVKNYSSADVYVMENTTWFDLEKISETLYLNVVSDDKVIYIINQGESIDKLLSIFDERNRYTLSNIRNVNGEVSGIKAVGFLINVGDSISHVSEKFLSVFDGARADTLSITDNENQSVKAPKANGIVASMDEAISYVIKDYDYNMYYDLLGELTKPETELISDLKGINRVMKVFKTYSKIYDAVEKDSDGDELLYKLLIGADSTSEDETYKFLKELVPIADKSQELAQTYAAVCWSESIVNPGFKGIEKVYESCLELGVLTDKKLRKSIETILNTYNGTGIDGEGLKKSISRDICAYFAKKIADNEVKNSIYVDVDPNASKLSIDLKNIFWEQVKDRIKKQLNADINATMKYKYYDNIQYQADNAARSYRMKKDYIALKYTLYVYFKCAEMANISFEGRKGFDQKVVKNYIDGVRQIESDIINIPDVDLANHEDTYSVDFENIQKTVENTTEVYGSNTQNVKDRDSSMEQATENVNEIEADDSVPVFYNEGENGVYTGYIMEGGTRQFIWFNDAERVFAGTAREKELGLMVDCDYEIYDPNPDFVAYNFSSACQYSLLRWNSDGTAYDENVDQNVFFNNVDEWTFVAVEMMDGKVIRVSELYSPQ